MTVRCFVDPIKVIGSTGLEIITGFNELLHIPNNEIFNGSEGADIWGMEINDTLVALMTTTLGFSFIEIDLDNGNNITYEPLLTEGPLISTLWGDPTYTAGYIFVVRDFDEELGGMYIYDATGINRNDCKFDLNSDGESNILDLTITINYILATDTLSYPEFLNADVNNDSIINVLDVIEQVNLILDNNPSGNTCEYTGAPIVDLGNFTAQFTSAHNITSIEYEDVSGDGVKDILVVALGASDNTFSDLIRFFETEDEDEHHEDEQYTQLTRDHAFMLFFDDEINHANHTHDPLTSYLGGAFVLYLWDPVKQEFFYVDEEDQIQYEQIPLFTSAPEESLGYTHDAFIEQLVLDNGNEITLLLDSAENEFGIWNITDPMNPTLLDEIVMTDLSLTCETTIATSNDYIHSADLAFDLNDNVREEIAVQINYYLDNIYLPPAGPNITCDDEEIGVLITVEGGTWGEEVSWDLINSSGQTVLSGGAPFSEDACLTNATYTLNAFDSYGDGWNGNVFSVVNANGFELTHWTLNSGSSGTTPVIITDEAGPVIENVTADQVDGVFIVFDELEAVYNKLDPNPISIVAMTRLTETSVDLYLLGEFDLYDHFNGTNANNTCITLGFGENGPVASSGGTTIPHNPFVFSQQEGDAYLVASHYEAGIALWDMHNPLTPNLIDIHDTFNGNENEFNGTWGVYVHEGDDLTTYTDDVVFASDINGGLYILEFDVELILDDFEMS